VKIIIHRGTHEIGGSCVEIKSENSKILIDFGIPLVNENKEPFDSKILSTKSIGQLKQLKILPDISGLYRNEGKAVDAVLISHSHLDHYGFLKFVNPEIPIYMSEGAKHLIEISDIFIPYKTGLINSKILNKGKKTEIGDFIGINVFHYYLSNFGQIFLLIMLSGILIGAISSFLATKKYVNKV